MENKNLARIKLLINRIADLYDPPPVEQTEEMRILTGRNWSAEDLKMACFEYWSHHSLDETAYMLLHGDYPPVCEEELVFWRYKPGVRLDDSAVYEKYRFGRGASDAPVFPRKTFRVSGRFTARGWRTARSPLCWPICSISFFQRKRSL